jgi:hypothetical protein
MATAAGCFRIARFGSTDCNTISRRGDSAAWVIQSRQLRKKPTDGSAALSNLQGAMIKSGAIPAASVDTQGGADMATDEFQYLPGGVIV